MPIIDPYIDNVTVHNHFDYNPSDGFSGYHLVAVTGDAPVVAGTFDPLSEFTNSLLMFDGATNSTVIDAGGATWSTLSGAHIVAGAGRNGTGALDLSSAGARAVVTSAWNNIMTVDSADNFTVDCWMAFNTLPVAADNTWMSPSTHACVFSTGASTTSSQWSLLVSSSHIFIGNMAANMSYCKGAHGMTAGFWYHVALSRQGNTTMIFVNGVLVASDTSTIWTTNASYYGAGSTYIGSCFGSGSFNGIMDSIRFTVGACRFNTAFNVGDTNVATFLPIRGKNTGAEDTTGRGASHVDGNISTGTVRPGRTTSIRMNRNQRITASSSSTVGSWSGRFYFGAWIWIDPSATNSAMTLFETGTANMVWHFYLNASRAPVLGVRGNGNGTTLTGNIIASGTWKHVAMVVYASTVYVYVDGVYMVSAGIPGWNPLYGGNDVTLFNSAHPTYTSSGFCGCVSDVVFELGHARYQSAFTPPASLPKTGWVATKGKPLLPFISTSQAAGIGAAASSTIKKFGASSYAPTTISAAYSIVNTASAVLTGGSGADFTIEAWVRVHADGSGLRQIMASTFNSSNGGWSMAVVENVPRFEVYWSTAFMIQLRSQTKLNIGQWYHVAVTRTSNVLAIFVDGHLEGECAWTGGAQSDSPSGMLSYGFNSGNVNTNSLLGYLDEFRITKGISRYARLPDSAEGDVLGRATQVFMSMDPVISGFDALSHMVQLQISASGASGGTTFTDQIGRAGQAISGGVKTSSTGAKWGNSCMRFNGAATEYIATAISTDFDLSAVSEWCWEAWVNDLTGSGWIVSRQSTGSDGWALATNKVTGQINDAQSGAHLTWPAKPVNEWHHYALQVKAGMLEVYVNGRLQVSKPITNIHNANTNVLLGCAANGGAVSLNGSMDDVRFTKGASRYTDTLTLPVAHVQPDDAWSMTSLAMRMDGSIENGDVHKDSVILNMQGSNITDDCGNKVLAGSSVSVQLTGGPDGSHYMSMGGNGSPSITNQVRIASNTSMLLDGDFTAEMWMKYDAGGATTTLMGARTTGALKIGINGNWQVEVSSEYGSVIIPGTGAASVTNGVWTHVAVVRAGTNLRLYVGGALVGSNTWTNSFAAPLDYIYLNDSSYLPNVRLSDVRITKVARYSANFAPSTSIPLRSPTFTDLKSHDAVVSNVSLVSDAQVFDGKCARFWGVNDPSFMHVLSNDVGPTGTGDYSVDFWMKPNTIAAAGLFDSGGLNIRLESNGSLTVLFTVMATGIVTNAWYHICVARESGLLRVYVNGSAITVMTDATNLTCTNGVFIGNMSHMGSAFDGSMHNLRVVKGGVTTAIKLNQAPVQLKSITPNVLMDSARGVTFTNKTGPVVCTDIKKNGTASLRFSKATDLLVLPSIEQYYTYTDFTIDFWMLKPNVCAATTGVLNYNAPVVNFGIYINNAGIMYYTDGGYSMTIWTPTSIPIASWFHVAVVRRAAVTTLYINGTGVVASSNSTPQSMIGNTVRNAVILGNAPEPYYLDSFRMTNAARWTTNFTPPVTYATTPLPAYVVPTQPFPDSNATISGTVYDENGNVAVRRVMGYDRETGQLMRDTYSNADGSYVMNAPANSVFVVALDDEIGAPLNAVIEDRVVPS